MKNLVVIIGYLLKQILYLLDKKTTTTGTFVISMIGPGIFFYVLL